MRGQVFVVLIIVSPPVEFLRRIGDELGGERNSNEVEKTGELDLTISQQGSYPLHDDLRRQQRGNKPNH
jgi:hypothetical protein